MDRRRGRSGRQEDRRRGVRPRWTPRIAPSSLLGTDAQRRKPLLLLSPGPSVFRALNQCRLYGTERRISSAAVELAENAVPGLITAPLHTFVRDRTAARRSGERSWVRERSGTSPDFFLPLMPQSSGVQAAAVVTTSANSSWRLMPV